MHRESCQQQHPCAGGSMHAGAVPGASIVCCHVCMCGSTGPVQGFQLRRPVTPGHHHSASAHCNSNSMHSLLLGTQLHQVQEVVAADVAPGF